MTTTARRQGTFQRSRIMRARRGAQQGRLRASGGLTVALHHERTHPRLAPDALRLKVPDALAMLTQTCRFACARDTPSMRSSLACRAFVELAPALHCSVAAWGAPCRPCIRWLRGLPVYAWFRCQRATAAAVFWCIKSVYICVVRVAVAVALHGRGAPLRPSGMLARLHCVSHWQKCHG